MPRAKTVVVAGAGGNIGSHLVPHLARMSAIGRLVLVDRESYEPRNRENQDASPRAAGRGKAGVQAERARRLNPECRVEARRADVETMPLGALRGDLILSCLDSRRARQAVNLAAWRLGVPWLDAGVRADGLLARVTRFHPDATLPCLECGWDEADYAALEQRHPCGNGAAAVPTGAPSGLGALAASLLALECAKLLGGPGEPLAPGTSVVVDAAHHRHFVTSLRRNPACRLTRHAPWPIEPFAELATPLGLLLGERGELRIEGRSLVRRLGCGECGWQGHPWRLAGRLGARWRRCRRCGAGMAPSGWDQAESVTGSDLPARLRARPLAALALGPGDVVTLTVDGVERHLELVGR